MPWPAHVFFVRAHQASCPNPVPSRQPEHRSAFRAIQELNLLGSSTRTVGKRFFCRDLRPARNTVNSLRTPRLFYASGVRLSLPGGISFTHWTPLIMLVIQEIGR